MSIPKILKGNKKQNQEPPKQYIPVSTVDRYIQRNDGKWVASIEFMPINRNLMPEKVVNQIVKGVREVLNQNQSRVSFNILSQRLNVDAYDEFLEKMMSQQSYAFFIHRIEEMRKEIVRKKERIHTIKRFFFTIEALSKKKEEAAKELSETIHTLQQTLKQKKVVSRAVDGKEIKQIMYAKLNPITSLYQPYTSDMTLQEIKPAPIIDQGSHCIIDDMYMRFYTITKMPQGVDEEGWLDDLFGKEYADAAIIMNVTNKDKMQTALSNQHSIYKAKLMEKLPEHMVEEYQKKKDDTKRMIKALSGNENLFTTFVVFTVYGDSLEKLLTNCKDFERSVSGKHMKVRKLTYKGPEPFFYMLPILYNSEYEKKIEHKIHSLAIASILPFNSADHQDETGIIVGENVVSTGLVIVNPFIKRKYHNPNEIFLGISGSGKSTAVKKDILEYASIAVKIFAIDPEGEYGDKKFKLPSAVRETIYFSVDSKHCINVFNIRTSVIDSDKDEGEEEDVHLGRYLRRKITENMSFFRWLVPDMTIEESSLIIKAQEIAYKKSGIDYKSEIIPKGYLPPTLSTFEEALKELEGTDRIVLCMYPYISGAYSNLFNGQTNYNTNKPITVLDIKSLSKEIRPAVMDLLIKDLWEIIKENYFRKNPIFMNFYIDELYLLADKKYPQTLEFIFELAKRIRKYFGRLIPITQNVDDLFSIEKYGTGIYNNCLFKRFFQLSDQDVMAIKTVSNDFSERELEILAEDKNQGRCLYQIGKKRIEVQITPTMDQLQFVDPELYQEMLGKGA
ncbi:hypothetical protein ABHN11_24375 [Brevibacillus centrosporus]|uniref:VirB4 family type IV secretion system protein n=1 Tax=Brevibacillus centrosporus TaxID=54910 RepID=UPI003D1FDFD9